MIKHIPAIGSLLFTGLSCMAQAVPHTAGFTFNVSPGATSRNGITTAVELMTRIDFSEYRGLDDTLEGLQFIAQDQDVIATPGELFDIFVYNEDPANADFPNIVPGNPPGTTAITGVTGVGGPTVVSPGSTVVGAALFTLNFGTPPNIGPISTDMFVAFSLPAAPTWTADGLSIQINLGTNPNFPAPTVNTFDASGPASVAQNSYGLAYDVSTGGIIYGGRRQLMCDLMTDLPSGVTTAITNQTSYPLSNAAPGTASFFSGLHPDATPTRGDNLGYVLTDTGLTAGSLVVFLADFDFFPIAGVQLSSFVPGSVGPACITNPQVLTLAFAAGTQVTNVVTIPATFRPRITGSHVVWNAIAFDAGTNQLRAAYCGKQNF